MTNPSKPDVSDRVVEEHDAIQTPKSEAWEERLRVARLQREKVLAVRARLADGLTVSNAEAAVEDLKGAVATLPTASVAPSQSGGLSVPAQVQKAEETAIPAAPNPPFDASVAQGALAATLTRTLFATNPPLAAALQVRRVMVGPAIGMAFGLLVGLVLQPLAIAIMPRPAAAPLRSSGPLVFALPPVFTTGIEMQTAPPALGLSQPLPSSHSIAPLTAPSAAHETGAVVSVTTAKPEVWPESPTTLFAAVPETVRAPVTTGSNDIRPALFGHSLPSLTAVSDQTVSPILWLQLPKPVKLSVDAPARMGADPPVESSVGLIISKVVPTPHLRMKKRQALRLARPAAPDVALAVSGTVSILGAAAFWPILHVAQGQTGASIRIQLADLGLENSRIMVSEFGAVETTVVFYRAEEAKVAQQIAALYSGQTIDMTGFAPAPSAGRLDLYINVRQAQPKSGQD